MAGYLRLAAFDRGAWFSVCSSADLLDNPHVAEWGPRGDHSMQLIRSLAVAALALLVLIAGQGAGAFAAERRLALVIGEAAYPVKPIATAANDAGLVAQTLQAAGFDVTGARDLEEAALKQAFRDFLDKAAQAGPDAVVFIYVSGYGLQLEGENYILPVDATIARDTDIPLRALRVSDYLKPLAGSGAKLVVAALDVARANPFKLTGQPLAGGLALYEPGGRALLAFNAAPGTIAPESKGDYGPYAHALSEMMRDGGRPLTEVFENTRLRVSEMTKGAQIPWNSQRVETDFLFFEREANAPLRKEDVARLGQPISALGADDGFSAAVRRDTMQGYQDYVATYPASPYAKRARAMLAARREAMTWRRSRIIDTPDAYWSYLRRYPRGPHAWDARRRLAELRYEFEPPPDFAMIDYGYPPPPPDELIFIDQPVIFFDDPLWAFPPPPPPPFYFLPPPPPDFIILPPPIVVVAPYALPAPPYVPIPVWQRPPAYIAPPPPNVIYANMHNAVALNPAENQLVIRNPAGAVISTEALTAVGAGAAAVGIGAALPNFIAKRNAVPPGGVAPAPIAGTPFGPTPAIAPAPAAVPAGLPGARPLTEGATPPGAAPLTNGAQQLPGGGPAGQRLHPGGVAPPNAAPAAALPAGLPVKDHALPQPPAGAAAPLAGPGRRSRDVVAPTAPSGAAKEQGLSSPAGAGPAPAQTGRRIAPQIDRLGSPAGDGASPLRGRQLGRTPPVNPGGGASRLQGEGPDALRSFRRRMAPDFGGPAGPAPGAMQGARLPRQMREAPPGMDMPGMRGMPDSAPRRAYPRPDMPAGMGAPMRGPPRDAMPQPDAMPAARYRSGPSGGLPPPMRDMQPRMPDAPPMRAMTPPQMHAPAMDRPPPGMTPGFRAPPSPQQAAPAPRLDQWSKPRRGDGDSGFHGFR
jgi:uncharacterized caspase-like protein